MVVIALACGYLVGKPSRSTIFGHVMNVICSREAGMPADLGNNGRRSQGEQNVQRYHTWIPTRPVTLVASASRCKGYTTI